MLRLIYSTGHEQIDGTCLGRRNGGTYLNTYYVGMECSPMGGLLLHGLVLLDGAPLDLEAWSCFVAEVFDPLDAREHAGPLHQHLPSYVDLETYK